MFFDVCFKVVSCNIPLNEGRKVSNVTTTGVRVDAQPVCPSACTLTGSADNVTGQGWMSAFLDLLRSFTAFFFLTLCIVSMFLAFKFRRVVRGGSQLLSDLFFWKDFYD